MCIIIANIPNTSHIKKGKVNRDWWGLFVKLPSVCSVYLIQPPSPPPIIPPPSPLPPVWKNEGILVRSCHLAIRSYQLFWGGEGAEAVVVMPPHTWTHGFPHTMQTLKGIRNISMFDELPQITSLQHFHDIVAVLPHYHNVTAVVWWCCVWAEGGTVWHWWAGGGSAAGIWSLQMSWLIKGSSIKVIEKHPPPSFPHQPLSACSLDKGEWSTGDRKPPCRLWHYLACTCFTCLRLSPQVPLCSPPLLVWHSPWAPKWNCSVFNPSCSSTHPPLLPSVTSTAGGKKWGMVLKGSERGASPVPSQRIF